MLVPNQSLNKQTCLGMGKILTWINLVFDSQLNELIVQHFQVEGGRYSAGSTVGYVALKKLPIHFMFWVLPLSYRTHRVDTEDHSQCEALRAGDENQELSESISSYHPLLLPFVFNNWTLTLK
jgi:hypothetical protein